MGTMGLIVAVSTALGSLTAFVMWLYRTFWGKKAKIAKLRKELKEIEYEMQKARAANDMDKFHILDADRLSINEEIRGLLG